jgi:DNA-binding IclR family transcriptional regulator
MPGNQGRRAVAVKKKGAPKPGYSAPALEKGLDVLEVLAKEPAGLTTSEIARRLGRTVSEIFRMVLCLGDRGYLTRQDGDRYSLTLKLFKMVQEHPPTERVITQALPVMQRLVQKTQQSCHLGVIEGAEVVFIAQVNAPTAAGFYVRLGSSTNLMNTASGYVILAHQSLEHRQHTLDEWRRVTGERIPADIGRHLSQIEKAGFEKKPSYQVHGVVNISFPIFNAEGSALGALTTPYIERKDDSVSVIEVSSALNAAAIEITGLIGGRAPKKRGTA